MRFYYQAFNDVIPSLRKRARMEPSGIGNSTPTPLSLDLAHEVALENLKVVLLLRYPAFENVIRCLKILHPPQGFFDPLLTAVHPLILQPQRILTNYLSYSCFFVDAENRDL